jgi:diadenosine tetraphosphatase ApaH/serine/threonine PP2A family protein phosphatase
LKVAVISDVHANLAALEATLAAIDAAGADELWCLGDLTGYGGDPGPCLEIVLDRTQICLAGNHDMVIAGEITIDAFSHDARTAAEWTMGVLDADQLQRLAALRPTGERHDVELNHGSIRDPVWEYVIDDRTAAICIEHQSSPLGMVGHSHVPLAYGYADGAFIGGLAPAGTQIDIRPGPFLLNPGSVGQPRDGDPRAAHLIVDLETGAAQWHRVEYDIAAAQRAIRSAGLPARLGTRLAEGY